MDLCRAGRMEGIRQHRSLNGPLSLRSSNWSFCVREGPPELEDSLEELLRLDPAHTTAEACRRIEEATGVKRGLTQVRRF